MRRFRSFAKVNLHLEVVGRRPDGYHELRTLFQSIDFGDELGIERAGGGVALEIEGADLPRDRRNLAVRAAEGFLARWGRPGEGVRLRLVKRLPAGGGLGGGSANAATTLLGMAAVWGFEPPAAELLALARELGADVPFFLTGGAALGLGRGDEILPLADAAEPVPDLWLALPSFAIETAAVFAALSPRPGSAALEPWIAACLAGRPPAGLVERIGRNDLEAAAFRLRPELEAIYTSLVRMRARVVRMSGSGSTLFAVFDDSAAAAAAGAVLPPGTDWVRVRALGRSAWLQASGLGAPEGEN